MAKSGWVRLGTFRVINYEKDTVFDDTKFLLEITNPYTYQYEGVRYRSEIGDVSDGASIPDFFECIAGNNFNVDGKSFKIEGRNKKERMMNLKKLLLSNKEALLTFIRHINKRGSFVPAAFIHDKLCNQYLSGNPVCDLKDAHKIFYHAMLDNRVPKFSGFLGLGGAWAKYQAVKIGMKFNEK